MGTLTGTISGDFGYVGAPSNSLKLGIAKVLDAGRELLAHNDGVNELRSLSDAQLHDIGFSRSDLPLSMSAEIENARVAVGYRYGR